MAEGAASRPRARVHHYQMAADRDADGGAEEDSHAGEVPKLPMGMVTYYQEYHGHQIPHLAAVTAGLRRPLRRRGNVHDRRCIFLVGDSSFDNKYWLDDHGAAVNGYERVLRPPEAKLDVAYWLNKRLAEADPGTFCVNCAVEESTVADRTGGKLLAHDQFVRDSLRADDVLIVSIGGNDIALRPSACTIANIGALLCQPMAMIERGWAVGLGHFVGLFKTQVEEYVASVCAKQKPKLVVVCMIYYLDEESGGSWADTTLSMLGYNRNPAKLQLLIRKVFELATSQIEVQGVEVRAFPLFKVLDGKTTDDYAQRVEPSAQGGAKMGTALVDFVLSGKVPGGPEPDGSTE